MRTFEMKIDESLCNMIEQRQYELAGLKDLLGFAWSNTTYNIPQEKIAELEAKHNMVNKEYELLKETITNLIPEDFDRSKTSWTLNFTDKTVYVTEE